MALVRSFTVGNGDMFYIRHNSDNFTILDCQLFGDHKDWLIEEIVEKARKRASLGSYRPIPTRTTSRD